MSGLGNCKSCEGPLVVSVSYAQDNDGRLLGVDGRALPISAGGQPMGKVAQRSQVSCSECRLPVPEHPYQQELDAARRQVEAEARKPAPPPAPLPYEPVAAEPYRLLTDRLAHLERQLNEVLTRLSMLETGAKRRAS